MANETAATFTPTEVTANPVPGQPPVIPTVPPRADGRPPGAAKGDSYLYCATITINGIKYGCQGHGETKETVIRALHAMARHTTETTGQEVSVDENDVHFMITPEFGKEFADKVRAEIPAGMTAAELSPDSPAQIFHKPQADLKAERNEVNAGNLADEMR